MCGEDIENRVLQSLLKNFLEIFSLKSKLFGENVFLVGLSGFSFILHRLVCMHASHFELFKMTAQMMIKLWSHSWMQSRMNYCVEDHIIVSSRRVTKRRTRFLSFSQWLKINPKKSNSTKIIEKVSWSVPFLFVFFSMIKEGPFYVSWYVSRLIGHNISRCCMWVEYNDVLTC